MSVDDRTHRILEKLIKTANNRKETFGKPLVGFALARTEVNELKVCFGLVHFLKKEEVANVVRLCRDR